MRGGAEPGAASPVDLLVTSEKSFGLMNIAGASEWKEQPRKQTGDLGGPLAVAMAAERPKASPSAPHGPRIVVIDDGRSGAGDVAVLTAAGFDARLTRPAEVLSAIERGETPGDLIVTPLALPGIAGPALAARARAACPALRVIFVSGTAGEPIDPLKTTIVQDQRSMTTWVMKKA